MPAVGANALDHTVRVEVSVDDPDGFVARAVAFFGDAMAGLGRLLGLPV